MSHSRGGLALLFAILLAGSAWAAEPAGEVLALQGACTVDGRALKPGDAVSVGEVVAVPPGGRIKLRMIDGSVLSAAENSRLEIKAYTVVDGGRDARLGLTGGLLHSVVSKMPKPSRFEVGTAVAVAAVRSTDWFVEAGKAATKVGVREGVVDLKSQGTGGHVELGAWAGARVEPGKDPTPPRKWVEAEFKEYAELTD
jgi:hypothetical protein